jgi:hypothetical protein
VHVTANPADTTMLAPMVREQAIDAEHARRAAVIARVINGELLLREAAPLLGMSVARVSELKRAWEAAGGPDGVRPRRGPGGPATTAASAITGRPQPARHDHPAGQTSRAESLRQRKGTIEPMFGDIRTNRRITRFLRRGHDAVRTEWHWILLGHNLTILHQRTA